MKATTRSSSYSTWGDRGEVHCSRPLFRVEQNATAPRSAARGSGRTARPRSSSSQASSSSLRSRGSSPSRIRGAGPAGELRGDRHEQLVDQPGGLQLAVQARAALAEQRPDPALLAAGSAAPSARSTPVRRGGPPAAGSRSAGGSASEAVKTTILPPPVGEQRRVPGQVEAAARRSPPAGRGGGRSARAGRAARVGDDPAVALGAHRPGADHHRVEAGPQPLQHLGVGVASRSGPSGPRSPPARRG